MLNRCNWLSLISIIYLFINYIHKTLLNKMAIIKPEMFLGLRACSDTCMFIAVAQSQHGNNNPISRPNKPDEPVFLVYNIYAN